MAYAERFSQDAPTDRLLAFIEFLRGRDILISPADSLVAMEAAGLELVSLFRLSEIAARAKELTA